MSQFGQKTVIHVCIFFLFTPLPDHQNGKKMTNLLNIVNGQGHSNILRLFTHDSKQGNVSHQQTLHQPYWLKPSASKTRHIGTWWTQQKLFCRKINSMQISRTEPIKALRNGQFKGGKKIFQQQNISLPDFEIKDHLQMLTVPVWPIKYHARKASRGSLLLHFYDSTATTATESAAMYYYKTVQNIAATRTTKHREEQSLGGHDKCATWSTTATTAMATKKQSPRGQESCATEDSTKATVRRRTM